jgi:hypothetical protein
MQITSPSNVPLLIKSESTLIWLSAALHFVAFAPPERLLVNYITEAPMYGAMPSQQARRHFLVFFFLSSLPFRFCFDLTFSIFPFPSLFFGIVSFSLFLFYFFLFPDRRC